VCGVQPKAFRRSVGIASGSLGTSSRNGSAMANHKIEIRRRNVKKILLAAEKVFAEKGYGGTAMADIAELAELPRSNLHYYFSTKDELYRAVLLDLLEVWKQDAQCFEVFDDPRVVLSSYIRAKMNHSRSRPYGSKVWANEIIHGAPVLGVTLDEGLYDWAKMKEAKIRKWVEDKRILAVEPSALLYMIWASTQHYADFSHQVSMLNEHQALSELQFERAVQTVTAVILRGIGLEP
jgi:TetR/AcrR family transcriptional regulator